MTRQRCVTKLCDWEKRAREFSESETNTQWGSGIFRPEGRSIIGFQASLYYIHEGWVSDRTINERYPSDGLLTYSWRARCCRIWKRVKFYLILKQDSGGLMWVRQHKHAIIITCLWGNLAVCVASPHNCVLNLALPWQVNTTFIEPWLFVSQIVANQCHIRAPHTLGCSRLATQQIHVCVPGT